MVKKCGEALVYIFTLEVLLMEFKFATELKTKLSCIVSEMAATSYLFVRNPSCDFSRNRKMNFETFLMFSLSMGAKSIQKELLDYFSFDKNMISESGFCQQKEKVLPETFEYLFRQFTDSTDSLNLYHGYRLLACDGTIVNVARNPEDSDMFFYASGDKSDKGYSQLHLNALYDLVNRIYIDATLEKERPNNELRELEKMVDRSTLSEKAIIVSDRGYECYNTFAHIIEKGWKFVIRIKDIDSMGLARKYHLPDDEFDQNVETIITRKQTNKVKAAPEKYTFISRKGYFEYVDLHHDYYYPMSFRIVRFKISEDSYECIATNLSRDDFPTEAIKEIYRLRWGIETSFRELKYAVGLVNLHSKKLDFIKQEIFARLIVYNFCELITSKVIIEQQKKNQYTYQANFTMAIYICKKFLQCNPSQSPPDIELLIRRNTLPIRPGRKDPRKVRTQSAVSFLYRVA